MKNQQFCDGTSMDYLSATSVSTSDSVQSLLDAVSCRALNIVFTGIVHDSMCGPFLWGVYMCWVVHVSASFLIWAAFLGFPCVKEPPVDEGQVYVDSADEGVQMK